MQAASFDNLMSYALFLVRKKRLLLRLVFKRSDYGRCAVFDDYQCDRSLNEVRFSIRNVSSNCL